MTCIYPTKASVAEGGSGKDSWLNGAEGGSALPHFDLYTYFM